MSDDFLKALSGSIGFVFHPSTVVGWRDKSGAAENPD
jgi:hypothetical protein